MLNGWSSSAGRRREDADLTGDFARGQIPDEPHLPGQAEAARHRAPDLRRDAERHRRRVRDEHRLDAPAIRELEGELPRPVRRDLVADDARRVDDELVLKPGAKRLRQVCHPAEIGDAAACRSSGRSGGRGIARSRSPRAASRARPARAQRGHAAQELMLSLAFSSRCEQLIVASVLFETSFHAMISAFF